MKTLRFYDFMRSAHVKRWHIVSTIHNQSLAEHQFLVTLIALDLFNRIVGVKDDPQFAFKLVLMAAFHDMAEVRTGDIPTPAKAQIRESMSDTLVPDVFKRMERELMPEIPYLCAGWPSSAEGKSQELMNNILKMADMIADAWWITENAMGIHGKMVANGNVQAMMRYAAKLDDEDTARSDNWIQNVNAVLQELGMPYISVSLRDTPP